MPIRNSQPLSWRPKGLTDSLDGTNSFEGAMRTLQNVIPDPSTARLWRPRPAATEIVSTTGEVSGDLVVGDLAYGMRASATFPGFDEPFVYDLANDVFLTVSGIIAGNVPATVATTENPPILAQVAGRIIVCHPGFGSGTVKFGWFDISGANFFVTGNTVSGSRYITGNFDLLGVQPGMTVTGTGIPAGTTVVNTHPYFFATDITGDTHSNQTIDGIADTSLLLPTMQVSGSGIPNGTTIVNVHANSIDLSQPTSTTETAITIQVFGDNFTGIPASDGSGRTHNGATLVDALQPTDGVGNPIGVVVGLGIAGDGITIGSTVAVVGPGAQLDLNVNGTADLSGVLLQYTGATITLSAPATATNNQLQFQIKGGTAAAPLWGAGDTDNFPLPSRPLGVAMMAGRAYYACGLNGIVFSDSGFPCHVSNNPNLQVLTTNDGLEVTAVAPLMLSAPITGGIVQAIIAFQHDVQMRQITGDQATGNLAMNLLPVKTGTHAPLALAPCELGLAFISPTGLRLVRFDGTVTPPIGADGQGITQPFQNTAAPAEICGAANAGVLRFTTRNGGKDGGPYEEYWFDLVRQVWHGPHTFPAKLIQPWRTSFVVVPVVSPASLWQSDAYTTSTSLYAENGAELVWDIETVLMPDSGSMAMNAIVESNLACALGAGPAIFATALNESRTVIATAAITAPATSTGLRQRALWWNEPVIFKQMSVEFRGESDATLRFGNIYMRYEVLGYSIDDIDEDYLLLADDNATVLSNSELLDPG